MKQHHMTHKFRDSESYVPTTPQPNSKSPDMSPLTSPPSRPSSEPLSPSFTPVGVKRSQEEVGVSLVDRPPEKRAILCG